MILTLVISMECYVDKSLTKYRQDKLLGITTLIQLLFVKYLYPIHIIRNVGVQMARCVN
jgi:hypothetical protein